MYNLDYTEFYITNVCNLNCANCNRFNNFAFSGHQLWKDHAEQYQQWAKLINFKKIGIIGGEPLLNPDFNTWLVNIAKLWPNSEISIITNGTQLHKCPELYDLIKKFSDQVTVRISMHGFDLQQAIMDNVNSWLQQPVTKTYIKANNNVWVEAYNKIKDPSWPDCPTPENFSDLPEHIQKECEQQHHVSEKIWQQEVYATRFTDKNNVKVEINQANYFNPSTVIFNPDTKELRLHNSDPQKAIDVCYSKRCHHFIRGKFYKCAPVGLLPEFVDQFTVNVSKEDQQLIDNYVPADSTWSKQELDNFITDLITERVIPQCKFCPEQMVATQFEAGVKKVKLVKKLVSTNLT